MEVTTMNNNNNIDYDDIKLLSKEDRLKLLDEDVWIDYPKTKTLISLLTQYMNKPKRYRMQNILIIGESNIGKTSIVRKFEELHPSCTMEDKEGMSIVVRPVLFVTAPHKADEKTIIMSMLDSFWTPYNATDSLAKLKHQLIYLMRECHVKILVIDEIHHFLSGTAMQQRQVIDSLKNIGNILMIPIVGVGIKSAAQVISSDPQLSSRFDIVRLNAWELDINFAGLLKSFEKRLPLKKPSNLASPHKGKLLHSISSGNLGNLHRLLEECARYAIQNDIEEITLEIIEKFKWVKPTSALTPREIEL